LNLFDLCHVLAYKQRENQTANMKFQHPLILGAVVLGLAASTSVAELGDASKLPPAAKAKVDFAKDIKPLFEKSCAKCHSGDKPKGKYKMDTVANIVKGGSSGDASVIPGNSAKSPLAHYIADLVTDMEMPPTDKRDQYPVLTKEQIGLVRAWIDQGAK
jgi:mono/diheme cytochrome c family protein